MADDTLSPLARRLRTQAVVRALKQTGRLPEDGNPLTPIAGIKFKTQIYITDVPSFCKLKEVVETGSRTERVYSVKIPNRELTGEELLQLLKIILVRA